MENTNAVAIDATEMKPYQQLGVDMETGEEIIEDKYLYLPGRPREYRFNGQNGQFNLYGDRVLMDDRGKTLSSFTFQPIAYRFFEGILFGRTEREMWAELFFIDNQNCVSSIMFNNTSVSELFRLMEPLHYEKLSLCDVILTARPERVTSKGDPTKTWYITRFSYEVSKSEKVLEYREFVKDRAVYRLETMAPNLEHKVVSRSFARLLESLELPQTTDDSF
ncbi:hypothetical protein [Runella sp.]|uniref:hypothetical protein n=1 Tax=Runella sp. TaxID=1960881 RepID=UPI003D0AD352